MTQVSKARSVANKPKDIPSIYDYTATDLTGASSMSATLQEYANDLSSVGGGGLDLPSGNYLCDATVTLPYNVGINGAVGGVKNDNSEGVNLIVSATASFTNNFMFLCNASDGTTWDLAYPGITVPAIRNLRIDNQTGVTGTKAFLASGSWTFENIRADTLSGIIKTTQDYSDQVTIKRCHSRLPVGTDYQFEIVLLGDGLVIDQCSMGDSVSSPRNFIKVTGCLGGNIRSCIGGSIELDRCDGFTVNNYHTEVGNILIKDTNCSVRDSWIRADSFIPIIITNPLGTGRNHVVLDNVSTVSYLGSTTPTEFADLQISGSTAVSIRGCKKRIFENGVYATAEQLGWRVVDSVGASVDEFNDYSYALTLDSDIHRNAKVSLPKAPIAIGTASISLLNGSTGTSGKVTWDKATATYYYEAAIVYDPTRNIGRTNAVGIVSIALTNGGSGAILKIDSGTDRVENCFIKVWRGTTSGSYTEYVLIPIICANFLFDKGTSISGFQWISQTAAAAEVQATMSDSLTIERKRVVTYRNSAPTNGTWAVGDIAYNITPSAGGVMGRVCTTAGTPGTWKAFGTIAA